MSSRTPQELGKEGERRARIFLQEKGWRCLGANLRFPRGEIDLVFLDLRKELVFVEVRARTVGILQPPETTLGPRKIKSLLHAARCYVNRKRWEGYWRIDLITFLVRGSSWEIEYFEDITGGMLS